jgi:[ribosomal protein S5]-alanine N-acetyltransferase
VLPRVTRRLVLRELDPSDLDAVHRYASDPEVTRHVGWGPNDEATTRAFLSRARELARAKPRAAWDLGIVERASGALIGGCGAYERRPEHRDWEIGYVLARSHWRRGFGSEAVGALVELVFAELGAHRVFALVDPENAASAALLRGLGFRLEGHQRADRLVRGEWRDSLVFARLASSAPETSPPPRDGSG